MNNTFKSHLLKIEYQLNKKDKVIEIPMGNHGYNLLK